MGVGVSSVCVGVCVAACGGLFPWLGLAGGVCVGGDVVGVLAVPRHSWRRFLRVSPRHSWLGCAAGGGGRSSPLLAEGPGCGPLPLLAGVRWRWWCAVVCTSGVWSCVGFPASHGWGPLATAVAVCVGWAGGFSWCACLWRGACARGVCAGVCVSRVRGGAGVGLPCVLVCVCVCVGVWLGLAGACRWCGCGCGWCVPWLVPRHSWRRFLSASSRHSWLGFAVGGGGRSSPLLAEGPRCGSPPLLAGVRWRRWRVAACHSWVRSAGRGGGCLCGLGWGFLVLCVFVARCVRVWCLCWCVCRVFVVAWVWVCLPCVLVCVCVCVGLWQGPAGACRWCGCGCGSCVPWLVPRHSWRRSLSASSRHSLLGFAVGCGGWSSPLLAEGLRCGSPPLLAGVRWRQWCAAACHPWLRVPVLVPRHSWLGGSAGGGVGWTPATPGCGSRGRLPATPGWGPPAAAVGVSAAGGFLCCVCLWRGVCVWSLCWCVWCVFVVSVLVVVWVWACLSCVFVCVCVRVCVVC